MRRPTTSCSGAHAISSPYSRGDDCATDSTSATSYPTRGGVATASSESREKQSHSTA